MTAVLASALLCGCAATIHRPDHGTAVHGLTAEAVRRSLHAEVAAYQDLVEQSLTYRARTIAVADRLRVRIAAGRPLSGADLEELNAGMVAHLDLRERLLDAAHAHESWLGRLARPFPPSVLDPVTRLKGVMLSLSAALVLYDNFLLSFSLFEEDGRLRRFLNDPDSGYGIGRNEFVRISQSYRSAVNRGRTRRAMAFYEREREELTAALHDDEDLAYLDLLIRQSPSYSMVRAFSPIHVAGADLGMLLNVTEDTVRKLAAGGVDLFSMVFGNSVGLVETRRGRLHDRPEVMERLREVLRSGDILLEKTPFRLTDKFIPGHWGHVAVYAGDEAELGALGILEHPAVAPHRDTIRTGNTVIEALRSGVQISPLEQFLNIDDLAVLRDPSLVGGPLAETVVRAFRQVGKSYDFNFDVERTDKIVCSELCYVVFTHIDWETSNSLGRATISPDQVALQALDGGPLQLVLLYHDGQLVQQHPRQRLAELLGR